MKELRDAFGGHDRENLEDVLGVRNRASLEMHFEDELELNSAIHLEAMFKRVWRCTWWLPRSCNTEMHLEAEIKFNSEMHLDAVVERVWRYV